MKILLLTPYPQDEAPSQRFRFELFLNFLIDINASYELRSFVSFREWKILFQEKKTWFKGIAVVNGFLRRFATLFQLSKFHYIFIHRELTPFGPPIFEWIIAKVLKKKIIYDFDDAIWLPDKDRENPFWKWLKWRSKVSLICKWSWKVSVGNEYLADYARRYNKNVIVFLTVVDTEVHKPNSQKLKTNLPTLKFRQAGSQKPVIGWTGSHSTLKYLDLIIGPLRELAQEHDFDFLVIADRNPELPLKNFTFIKWQKDTEIEDLSSIDIGVMPLPDDEWSKGKCGFKLIQYLALGIPAVASPVGVNPTIIHSETGFLANSNQEWVAHLKKLITDPSLRTEMGRKGQKRILDNYSVTSQKKKFLSLFEG